MGRNERRKLNSNSKSDAPGRIERKFGPSSKANLTQSGAASGAEMIQRRSENQYFGEQRRVS